MTGRFSGKEVKNGSIRIARTYTKHSVVEKNPGFVVNLCV